MPDRQTTLKDRATQLLIKYKSGALVTQLDSINRYQSILWEGGQIDGEEEENSFDEAERNH